MSSTYVVAGRTFRRRSIVKLSPEERDTLACTGTVVLARPVEWPIPDRTPLMDRAHVDPGGTDIWGPGPYLKVPNVGAGEDWEAVNRVFCPWGYPPDHIRGFRRKLRMRIERVDLVQTAPASWEWRLTVRVEPAPG
ncbi:MAG: hypothetical protein AMXMBFR13_08710 [Phycisphaerae bacterium]